MYIDSDGAPDDADGDGVSDSCDNCPANANGFDCEKLVNGNQVFLKRCDVNNDSVVTEDELSLGNQKDADGNFIGDACDFLP
jgi:hypothetical protein